MFGVIITLAVVYIIFQCAKARQGGVSKGGVAETDDGSIAVPTSAPGSPSVANVDDVAITVNDSPLRGKLVRHPCSVTAALL